jgi:hypothetical protein
MQVKIAVNSFFDGAGKYAAAILKLFTNLLTSDFEQ